MAARPSLVLVKRRSFPFRGVGSTVMRADQLCAMTRPLLASRINLKLISYNAEHLPEAFGRLLAARIPRGAVVLFVKFGAKGLTPGHLAPVRRRAAAVGLDVIDMPVGEVETGLFDFLVAASASGQRALARRLEAEGRALPVELMHHHADPRLGAVARPARRAFGCVYLGAPENAAIPAALGAEVDVLAVRHGRDMPRALARIGAYPLHFAVRPAAPADDAAGRAYKPLTKGFTAARCGANILLGRGADDAVELLGEDYPYLVDETDPAAITAGFERARAEFGGPAWQAALDRLDGISALVTPEALARRLEEITTRFA